MAEVKQKGRLLGGEAKQVLVVVVDDFHRVCKQHMLFSKTKLDEHAWGKPPFQGCLASFEEIVVFIVDEQDRSN